MHAICVFNPGRSSHAHTRNDRKELLLRKGLRAPVTRLEKQSITITVFIETNYSLGQGL